MIYDWITESSETPELEHEEDGVEAAMMSELPLGVVRLLAPRQPEEATSDRLLDVKWEAREALEARPLKP